MNPDIQTLETMIDRHGLPVVLIWLAEICNDKAEHITTNWQDTTTAKTWERNARVLNTTANSLS
jgi:hypothetical protein